MSAATSTMSNGHVTINGVQLYYERRGNGPSVLFIAGATGDAGHFSRVADALADEFTVVTYDRRGNSRSPRPVGWTTTTMDEQADDAAGLIAALGLGPSAVFGTSGGAVILLNLLLRHPGILRGAIIHEPPLLPILERAGELGAQFQAMTETALANGGPRAAMEGFIRLNAGDAVFEQLDPDVRERMLGNADVLFTIELVPFVTYVPDATTLAQIDVPVHILAGAEHRDADLSQGGYLYQSARWLADHLGTGLREFPGAHAPYFDHPNEMAEALRPLLRGFSRRPVT